MDDTVSRTVSTTANKEPNKENFVIGIPGGLLSIFNRCAFGLRWRDTQQIFVSKNRTTIASSAAREDFRGKERRRFWSEYDKADDGGDGKNEE